MDWKIKCRGKTCGAMIAFVTNPKTGKTVPVDVASLSPEDVDALTNHEKVEIRTSHARHHQTCPNVADFKRPLAGGAR